MQPNERLGLAFSALTVALFVIALILFISYGGSAWFYVVVAAALAIGILNAWMISVLGRRGRAPRMPVPSKRRASRRRNRK